MLTQKRLQEVLAYDPTTGIFTWNERTCAPGGDAAKVSAWNTRYSGKAAGVRTHGYIKISVDDQKHYAHRLAFLYMTGSFPKDIVDHINHDGENNSWENLRDADKRLNAGNQRRPRSNATGMTGAVLLPSGKFMAQRKRPGKGKYIGVFDTVEEAHAAYLAW